ncbi:hypothetical protein [Deinococcus planocerae]|uniref:hypothetical protein n=1 Tax=Deinococcus planocerae TaxID=1737569 RepID=UPI000C7EA02D|nr:hypothetical protein [Deinococcus planocerae]
MSQPGAGHDHTRGKNTFRLTALGLLSLTLMACGNVAQTPGAARGAKPDVQAQMLPCPESSDPKGGVPVNLVTCDPPEPTPDPDPVPPQPSPPDFAVSPAPGRPEITPEMADALRQAGLPDPYSIGQTYSGSCVLNVWASRWRRSTQTCLITATANRSLRSDALPGYQAVRWVNEDKKRCTTKEWITLADGANVKSRTEVYDIYGRAIEGALAVGKVQLSLKLGELREYHLNVVDFSTDRATVKVVVEAYGGGTLDTKPGGWCRGIIAADFVGR